MLFAVFLKRSAEKELEILPQDIQQRIIKRLLSLKEDPRPLGVKKLLGGERYRLRVGDYRVLNTIDDYRHLVEVSAVGRRREVYR
jgi:mRNA interferase RelE/StbE